MGAILGLLVLVTFLCVFFGSLGWIYRDAQARGKPGLLVAFLAALLAWPISLLVWIALRPPFYFRKEHRGSRRPFNLQDFRQQ